MTGSLIAAERAALVPSVGDPRPLKLPTLADETLSTGLRVLAARKPGVPRVEARLTIPTARGAALPSVRLQMVARTLLAGTGAKTAVDIAELLQRIGGSLSAHVDEDDLLLTGSCLSTELATLLDLMAEVVTDAAHPDEEVAIERDRFAQEVVLARRQPDSVARIALMRRLFGRHPYGRGVPTPEEVAAVKAPSVRRARANTLLPGGSVLTIVGDVAPAKAVAAAGAAFAPWTMRAGAPAPGLPAPPAIRPGPFVLIDRPGSVQTSIRMAGPSVNRHHPDQPALTLANLVVGGYFISRLSDNIRERRGYTYGVGSGTRHFHQTSIWTLQTDVGIEHTGAALVEIRYELERMLAGPLEQAELRAAKRYLAGTLAMSIQTQAGLASYLSILAVDGLPLGYLRDFPKRVEAVTEAEAIDAARRYLSPRNLVTVLVGDRTTVEPVAAAIGGVEVAEGP